MTIMTAPSAEKLTETEGFAKKVIDDLLSSASYLKINKYPVGVLFRRQNQHLQVLISAWSPEENRTLRIKMEVSEVTVAPTLNEKQISSLRMTTSLLTQSIARMTTLESTEVTSTLGNDLSRNLESTLFHLFSTESGPTLEERDADE